MGTTSYKARVSGLLGVCALMHAAPASALPAQTAVSITPLSDPQTLPFLLGCLAGAAAAGCISLIAFLHYSQRMQSHMDEAIQAAQTHVLPVINTSMQTGSSPHVSSADSTAHMSYEQLRATYDTNKRSMSATERMLNTPQYAVSSELSSRVPDIYPHSAAFVVPSTQEVGVHTNSSPAASAATVQQAPAVSRAHITHDYEDIAQNYVRQQTFKQRLQLRAEGVAKILSERIGTNKFDDLPVIERADGSVGDVGTQWWNTRMGDAVRKVGSLCDIPDFDFSAATLSQSAQVQPSVGLAEEVQPASAQVQSDSAPLPLSRSKARIDTVKRSETIAARVANVNIGQYPAKRTVDELDHADLWEAALTSMNNRIDEPKAVSDIPVIHAQYDDIDGAAIEPSLVVPAETSAAYAAAAAQAPTVPASAPAAALDETVYAPMSLELNTTAKAAEIPQATPSTSKFTDIVGATDTLDDPDHIEPKTGFIPFKISANHPEIVDASSYVDFLIRDEVARHKKKVQEEARIAAAKKAQKLAAQKAAQKAARLAAQQAAQKAAQQTAQKVANDATLNTAHGAAAKNTQYSPANTYANLTVLAGGYKPNGSMSAHTYSSLSLVGRDAELVRVGLIEDAHASHASTLDVASFLHTQPAPSASTFFDDELEGDGMRRHARTTIGTSQSFLRPKHMRHAARYNDDADAYNEYSGKAADVLRKACNLVQEA